MKKLNTLLGGILFIAFSFYQAGAQSPEKMSYQAVIRNSSNNLVPNTQVGIKITILQGSITGIPVYTETQRPTTNANGLASVDFGGGSGFNIIDWSNGPYFIKTETDPTGGTNYTITGTSQLLSVPFALHAKTADKLTNKTAVPTNINPRIATRGQLLSVSFSGGDDLTFSQSSSTCATIYADVLLSFSQASSTIIYPTDTYFIDPKRFDAIFDIPYYVPSGVYDIILSPSTSCPYYINSSFKIN